MDETKTLPYAGVTGFTAASQVDELLESAPPPTGRLIMCGVVLSKARLEGRAPKLPQRYPPTGEIPRIFQDQPGLLNLIHYRPDRADADTLMRALEIGGHNCHGLQINSPAERPWPDPGEIESLARRAGRTRIVLQVGRAAMADAQHNPGEIARRCRQYEGLLTDVLVDRSAGAAIAMGVSISIQMAATISQTSQGLTTGFAGGLAPHNVARHAAHAARKMGHEDFNIDAEGALRDANDRLDTSRAAEYLREAFAALDSAADVQTPAGDRQP